MGGEPERSDLLASGSLKRSKERFFRGEEVGGLRLYASSGSEQGEEGRDRQIGRRGEVGLDEWLILEILFLDDRDRISCRVV